MPATARKLPAEMVPYKWEPGVSANPAGRPKGSRSKLQEAVIKALYEDFTQHGVEAIVKVREKKPEVYLACCVALLPKQAQKIESPFAEVSDSELELLEQHLSAIRAKLVKDIDNSSVVEPVSNGQEQAERQGERLRTKHAVPAADGVLELEAKPCTPAADR